MQFIDENLDRYIKYKNGMQESWNDYEDSQDDWQDEYKYTYDDHSQSYWQDNYKMEHDDYLSSSEYDDEDLTLNSRGIHHDHSNDKTIYDFCYDRGDINPSYNTSYRTTDEERLKILYHNKDVFEKMIKRYKENGDVVPYDIMKEYKSINSSIKYIELINKNEAK